MGRKSKDFKYKIYEYELRIVVRSKNAKNLPGMNDAVENGLRDFFNDEEFVRLHLSSSRDPVQIVIINPSRRNNKIVLERKDFKKFEGPDKP